MIIKRECGEAMGIYLKCDLMLEGKRCISSWREYKIITMVIMVSSFLQEVHLSIKLLSIIKKSVFPLMPLSNIN